ncbi:LUD domain-containing protein [uncultured Ferrimonas sp.]|uniref:LutC/YkgG family protein n=1 Tax=uncultured Ferrimonas sp. TaxID=432640 RepID=UPI002623234A|nr:LUD domain-containing protein [uncultured Ferrimonas sp.]
MSSRETILAALEQMAVPATAMPAINIEPNNTDLLGQYRDLLMKVGGVLIEVTDHAAIQAHLDKHIGQGEQVLSKVDGIHGNRELNADPHQLHDVDLALINAEFAVAENGAVFVRSTATGHRALPFIAENLAVVVSKDNIVANMHEAVPRINLQRGELGAFIAGPSKTADIEQALVIGAHGACSMTVFVLG